MTYEFLEDYFKRLFLFDFFDQLIENDRMLSDFPPGVHGIVAGDGGKYHSNLPENLEVFAVLPVGYPKGEGKVVDRFDAGRIHWEA